MVSEQRRVAGQLLLLEGEVVMNWPNQAIDLTETRRTISFSMTSALSPAAERALPVPAARLVLVRP